MQIITHFPSITLEASRNDVKEPKPLQVLHHNTQDVSSAFRPEVAVGRRVVEENTAEEVARILGFDTVEE